MHTVVILLVVAALAYFLFMKPKTSIVGTYTIRGPGGVAFYYFAPDKTIPIFMQDEDRVYKQSGSATYAVSGSNVTLQMSPDSLPIAGRLELNGKLIVGGDGRQKQGMLKISDKMLYPKQMTELVDTGAAEGIISGDQLLALDRASRPFLQ